MFLSPFPSLWCKSHVVIICSSWVIKVLLIMPHLHIVVDCHNWFINMFTRSDTISDVRFALTVTIQKIADRWTGFSFYGAAYPMVGSLIGYGAYCGNANELCHSFGRSLACTNYILKYGARFLAPYKCSHPDGRSCRFYRGGPRLCSAWIWSRDLLIPS